MIMKKEILKIAGVKSEKEFYKKYPTEAAFMKAHGKKFKKAAMGAAMVKKQLNQLTDFGNPPKAEVGSYIGGEQSSYKPVNYADISDQMDYMTTGMNRQMRMDQANLAAQQEIAANSKKGGGIFDMLGQLAPQLDALSPDAVNISTPGAAQLAGGDTAMNAQFAAGGMRHGGYVPKAQGGFKQGIQNFGQSVEKFGQGVGKGYDKLDTGLKGVGGVQGALGIGTNLMQGFQQLKQEKEQKRGAKQAFQLSGVVKQAAGLQPDIAQRKYVRPENMAFGTQEMGQAYGAGTNFLAENGAMIGGTPTEIQNMYNPGTLYSNLGYEPLGESNDVKQYKKGGKLKRAQMGMASGIAGDIGGSLGSLIGGGKGRPTAGGKIGSTIGSTAGNLILPGVGGIIGGAIGGLAGGIFGGKSAKQTAAFEEGAQQNMNAATFMQGTKGIHGQFNNVMEDGGWISHDWQPQVITTFGEYKLKDLLKPPHDADMLRAGGHLKNYTAPSEAAMSTERPDFAMGGNLKTTWGGYAEPISQNPYLPGTGETVMFRGQSHDESDGNGNTGIGVKYGKGVHDSYTDYAEYGTAQADADVEVERDEPAVELPDAETGGESMVVYGNMKIPSYGVSELGDKKAKGKKFKSYANDLSKIEDRQNKIIDKGTDILDSLEGDSPFDMLKFNSAKAMVEGGNMKLKEIADKKMMLAGIQNAILDTAEEMGVESDALSQGKIKPIKDSDMGKFGKKIKKGQTGVLARTEKEVDPLEAVKNRWTSLLPKPQISVSDASKQISESTWGVPINLNLQTGPQEYGVIGKAAPFEVIPTSELTTGETKKDDRLGNILRQIQPYLIPSNQEPFNYQQITPEMFALASNQLEPVQAQTFQPLLEQPYTVSLQDQINEIQADVNASKRLVGNNPAALAAIDAQASKAKNQVLAQQLRMNQELQMGAYNRNRDVLNKSTLQNLEIMDRQYARQSEAKSKTKAQAQAALSSIADKMAKQKLENRTLGIYENMYNYRFGPKGRAYNVNAPMEWANLTSGEIETLRKAKEIEEKKGSKKESSAKNGSIVKAIKNL